MIHLGPAVGGHLVGRPHGAITLLVVRHVTIKPIGLPDAVDGGTRQVGRGAILTQPPFLIGEVDLEQVVGDLVVGQIGARARVLTYTKGAPFAFHGQRRRLLHVAEATHRLSGILNQL